MTNERLKTILYKAVKGDAVLGVIREIKKDRHRPVTRETVEERIVVVVLGLSSSQFERTFASINVYVPDVSATEDGKVYDAPNNKRLEELESACKDMFRSPIYGKDGSDSYLITLDKILTEGDEETYSHFLNVRLLIEIPNFNL